MNTCHVAILKLSPRRPPRALPIPVERKRIFSKITLGIHTTVEVTMKSDAAAAVQSERSVSNTTHSPAGVRPHNVSAKCQTGPQMTIPSPKKGEF